MGKIIAAERFRVIAAGGTGSFAAVAASAICFFRGGVFVATSGAALTGLVDRPKIMRWGVDATHWETVNELPLVEPTRRSYAPDLRLAGQLNGVDRSVFAEHGIRVPRDVGYGSMCAFRGKSDAETALYVGSMSREGAVLLRSLDGKGFEQVGAPGLGDESLYSLRGLTDFGGRLFVLPAGTVTDDYLDTHLPPGANVLVSEDPASGSWEAASEIGFGDLSNVAVGSLCAAHGRLYAGTLNPDRGFQLWQTAAEGKPPFEWEPVIVDGGGAFNQNLTVSAMAEFDGALYVGSGITGFGSDVVHEIGPASAELVRVHQDGSWDLIAGRMRFTRDGLKVPLSLLGPGLGDFYNSAIWALAAHEGALYLGTHQWEALRSLELNSGQIVGGYQLWASENGEDWDLVIDDGRGNPAEFGVAALSSTPLGLLVGTQNQSGLLKLIAERKRPGVDFKPGFDVLLGT